MPRYDRARARYREARALEMAAAGMDWPTISEELGYADRTGAYKAATRALRRRSASALADYRDRSLAEWDIVVESNWPAALAGDVRASEVVLAAMDKRDRLLGLTRCDRPHATPATEHRRAMERAGTEGRATSTTGEDLGVFLELGIRQPDRV